jgi:hypothetical protein
MPLRMQPRPILALCAVALGIPACEASHPVDESWLEERPPITWRGEYVEFGTDVETTVCPATLPLLDEYMASAAARLRSDATFPIAYYYLAEDLTHYGFLCPEGSLGCAGREGGRPVVGSRVPSLKHELIHAAMSSSPFHHRVLEEGLAVYLGTDLQRMGEAEPSDIRAAFASVDGNGEQLPEELYPVAGHFVSFLVDKYGLEDTVAFVDATETKMTLDELAELSLEHLGRDVRTDLDEYEAAGSGCEADRFSPMWFECEHTSASIPIFACDAGEEPMPIEVVLACGGEASGVQDGKIWKDILIDLPELAFPIIYLYEGHPVEFVIRSCGSGCSTPFARVFSNSEEPGPLLPGVELAPGLHVIRIIKPIEAEGSVKFSFGMGCF